MNLSVHSVWSHGNYLRNCVMREMGRVAIAGVHLEEEKEGPLGNRLPGVRPYAAFRPSVPKSAAGCQSACGLLGGRETKKLFGRRIWRATDECLAARSLTAAATATDGDATANDRRGKRREGATRERGRASACSPSVELRDATSVGAAGFSGRVALCRYFQAMLSGWSRFKPKKS